MVLALVLVLMSAAELAVVVEELFFVSSGFPLVFEPRRLGCRLGLAVFCQFV